MKKKQKKTKTAIYVNRMMKQYPQHDTFITRILIAGAYQAGYKARKREEDDINGDIMSVKGR